jgi:ribonuclease HI
MDEINQPQKVVIYTDGACLGNPGPGGYGVVLLYGKHRKELSGGFRLTTNNRMEIFAVIAGLRALKAKCDLTVYSDSQYVVNAIMQGWAKRWKARGWMRNKTDSAVNIDLWEIMLDLLASQNKVNFVWVRGHAGNKENERCDQLAVSAAMKPGLPPDQGYENPVKPTKNNRPTLFPPKG